MDIFTGLTFVCVGVTQAVGSSSKLERCLFCRVCLHGWARMSSIKSIPERIRTELGNLTKILN
jgi:hypothetical protein